MFRPVELTDKECIDAYMMRFGENSCQHSFVTMYSLSGKYGDEFCIRDGFLYVLRRAIGEDGVRCYLAPMGDGDRRKAYQTILEDAHAHQQRAAFMTLTEGQKEFVEREFPGMFEVTERRDYAEYLYHTEKLVQLPGHRLKDKRRELRLFWGKYGERARVDRLTKADLEEVWEFEQCWLGQCLEDHDREGLIREARMIRRQLDSFDELGLTGIVLRIDGIVRGFRYGVPLNSRCYDAIAEKGDRDIPHIYQVLKQEAARQCAPEYDWINLEEDVGVEGLRSSKLSYEPDFLLTKYYVEERGTI